MKDEVTYQRVTNRMNTLRAQRTSWWLHWQQLATYLLPRRFRWLATTNLNYRGGQINQAIIDSTGTIAARTCAAGMMSGVTSPARPWFRLTLGDNEPMDGSPARQWLDDVQERMSRVFADSNFYNSMATVYLDLAVFGTAVMIIYEDYEDIIRCYVPCAGEYFLQNSDRLAINVMYREFTRTAAQVIEEFGEENVSQNVKTLATKGSGGMQDAEILLGHAIEPNTPYEGNPVPSSFSFREVYWEQGQGGILRAKGFNEMPFIAPRWDIASNDPYGRSPGMDALGDVKQLQVETKRKAEAIDKMVRPPMVADVSLKNQPASMLPGGVTYVSSTGQANGFRPAFEVNPRLNEMMLDIQEVQQRIKTVFFNDLFLMISQLDSVRTATEIDARREEKLILLGPVLERFEDEALAPAIERTFQIMVRASKPMWDIGMDGLLPMPPEELSGGEIKPRFVSMLAEAQRAVSTTALERFLAFAGNMAGAFPSVLDNVESDDLLKIYADRLGVTPKVIRATLQVQQIRKAKMEAEQAAAQAEMAVAGIDAAKGLSEIPVGGGQSALSMMINGPQAEAA